MKRKTSWILAVIGVVLAACGGGASTGAPLGTLAAPDAGASFGTINGAAFTVRSAASQFDQCRYDGGSCLFVRLSEDPTLCDPTSSIGRVKAGSRFIDLTLERGSAGEPPPGTYSVRIEARTPRCGESLSSSSGPVNPTSEIASTNGQLTLTAVQGRVDGSVTIANGPIQLTGGFSATQCNYVDWEMPDYVKCGP